MKAIFECNKQKYQVNLAQPLDISLPLRHGNANVMAWSQSPPDISPVTEGDFTGSVAKGASVNFNNIFFNPHAHGTHTECVGHITEKIYSVNTQLKQFFFLAELITVAPEKDRNDFVISRKQLQNALGSNTPEALIIRTLPNDTEKYRKNYSQTNPPYLKEDAAHFIREIGVEHLLIDLPSVDKEKDEGRLLAHKAFWHIEGSIREKATITELIYVDNHIPDGSYLLNLQIAPFENDATPSKPVLYSIQSN
ncbi:cyclase family protein [Ascidiimonas aurantiaca]|uniref:cyclase family protein n=1 Tax=Ascidiimonas aurantiaca TaxID=1685432 RepID=UPI0030EDBBB5